MSNYTITRIAGLRMEVGGFSFRHICQYSATFSRNGIPMASLSVPVGLDMATHQLSEIHNAIGQLSISQRAHVYLTTEVLEEHGAKAGVGNQEIKIFEGRVSGIGYSRAADTVSVTIQLIHWVSDLNNASAASASTHPGSPYDLAYAAIFPSLIPGQNTPGVSAVSSWCPDLSSAAINEESLSNLWDHVLHKWLQMLAAFDPYDNALLGGGTSANADIIAAIERMVSPDDAPLALDLQGADANIIADGVRAALLSETGGNWINTTLWGKLIGDWSANYLFSVIPRVEDVIIAPFAGGLQGAPWATIEPDDYMQADIPSQMRQALRAVGIAHAPPSSTSFDLNTKTQPIYQGGLLGAYVSKNNPNGTVLLKRAPGWLSDSAVAMQAGLSVEGVNNSPIATAMDEAGTGAPATGPTLSLAASSMQLAGSAYAHQLYVLEALKGRTGEVVGKLRFDIAPGSNILVKASSTVNVPADQEVSVDLYATVMQVTYMIDVAAQQAVTILTLDHVRTADENTDSDKSVPKPPLYTTPWRGAKLVPAAPGP